jgi:hypothetical protein
VNHDPPVLPARLREVAIRVFLPEILHDLNNECQILDGTAVLLKAGAHDARKLRERAAALDQSSAVCERVAWMAGAISVALGADISPTFREEALPAFLELSATAIRRRGVAFRGEIPAKSNLDDPVPALALAALVRVFVGEGSTAVEFAADAGFESWWLEVQGGDPEPALAEEIDFLKRAFDIEARIVRPAPDTRRLLIGH